MWMYAEICGKVAFRCGEGDVQKLLAVLSLGVYSKCSSLVSPVIAEPDSSRARGLQGAGYDDEMFGALNEGRTSSVFGGLSCFWARGPWVRRFHILWPELNAIALVVTLFLLLGAAVKCSCKADLPVSSWPNERLVQCSFLFFFPLQWISSGPRSREQEYLQTHPVLPPPRRGPRRLTWTIIHQHLPPPCR
jgi:hypothetical protein